MEDDEVLTLRQSPAVHLLGTALGCEVGLLLVVLRQWALGLFVVLASGAWAVFLVQRRTRVLLTRRRVVVQGFWKERHVDMARIVEVRLKRESFAQTLELLLDVGGPFRVKDLREAEAAVPILKSLAKQAREPEHRRRDEDAPPPARAADELLRMPGRDGLDEPHAKRRARPVDLGPRQ